MRRLFAIGSLALASAAATTTPGVADATAVPLLWGVGAPPTWPDYAQWVPGNMAKQIALIQELGCTYCRCSFEGANYPAILDRVVPPAAAAGIHILPVLQFKITAADSGAANYLRSYQTTFAWASYAIAKGYVIPSWEIGNELENGPLVRIVHDGSSSYEFPDKTPGGFAAMAASLAGAYKGIKDAYAMKSAGEVNVLCGFTYRHWGLLAKLQQYNGSLPCDAISWHWYEPAHGSFSAPIGDLLSAGHGRTPAECLADFKKPGHPDEPMDVWITEMNRSAHTPAGDENGSYSHGNPSHQDWMAEAAAIHAIIQDLRKAPTVKAIFVYELLDEPKADGVSPSRLKSEGWFGLATSLTGPRKDAFQAYKDEIHRP